MRAMVAALAVVVVAGCASTVGTRPSTPVSTVSPTYSCTNADRTSVSPCSKESYDAAEKHLALVEEAKGVYRRQMQERIRILSSGGVVDATPTPEIEATMADPAKSDFMLLMRYPKDKGIKVVGYKFSAKMQESATLVPSDADVALDVCEDGRGSVFLDAEGKDLGESQVLVARWAFKRTAGSLKMYSAEYRDVPCPVV